MAEGLHVINKRVLQLTNESSVQGGGFKIQRKKTMERFTKSPGDIHILHN
jgi:hypothetical protein